ncbi:Uncharacterised protein [Streptococcus pneumoniae]|nr:Uncharacterised protein [Streptococcus pneumoniae]
MKFVVYKHSLVLGDNNIVTKQFIVLKHDDGNLQFTDFIVMLNLLQKSGRSQMMGINAFLMLLSF